jgi:hypothetical protein
MLMVIHKIPHTIESGGAKSNERGKIGEGK